MVNILAQKLYTALTQSSQSEDALCNNVVAWKIYNLLQAKGFIISDVKIEELISEILSLNSEDCAKPMDDAHSDEDDDHRFVSVGVNGIKKYGHYGSSRFLLNFNLKNEPASCVILGRNGAGKTSFYAAMEYVVLGEMFTAQLCNLEPIEFLRNKYSQTADMSIELKTSDSTLKYDGNVPKPQTVPAHFCSAWDVASIENSDNLSDYIYQQLGLYPFLSLKLRLEEIKSKLTAEYTAYQFSRDQASICFFEKILPWAFLLSMDNPMVIDRTILCLKIKALSGIELDVSDEYTDRNLDELKIRLGNNLTLLQMEMRDYGKAIGLASPPIFDDLESMTELIDNRIDDFRQGQYDVTILNDLLDNYNQTVNKLASYRNTASELLGNLYEKRPSRAELLTQLCEGWAQMDRLMTQINTSVFWNVAVPVVERLNQIDKLCDFMQKTQLEIVRYELKPYLDKIFVPFLNNILKGDQLRTNLRVDDNGTILVTLKPNEDAVAPRIEDFNPSGYLNTFRFKVFTVACKFALACCANALYKENWPFVLDDIFDSSDFDNRLNVRSIIEELAGYYTSALMDSGNKYPLQLIFFTQDDIIGDSVFGGLKLCKLPCKLCRLHKYGINPKAKQRHQYSSSVSTMIDSYKQKSRWLSW